MPDWTAGFKKAGPPSVLRPNEPRSVAGWALAIDVPAAAVHHSPQFVAFDKEDGVQGIWIMKP